MLAGDADRDRAANVLREAFAEGRLTQDEYEERIGRAFQARTYEELDVLTEDIPKPPPPPVPAAFRPYPTPYPRYPAPPYGPPQTNGKAVASLAVSIVAGWSFGVGPVVAIALGHTAKREIRRNGGTGDGLATAGLVIGYLSLALWVLVFIAAVTGS
ncbi:DUF1707 and DUF4190 domain-containing protein [Streptomyces sp. NBC_01476]|uniref:DUF1707 and DUF4190 domain-containing protein n=1 Tax=Streptomyces sp. NBC_01476 TaxID=2903881 RepID=UPI002E345D60|nr:DUF1707 and DUF4190 domain-containing protein [Streptomyces sp. NBC_01476]